MVLFLFSHSMFLVLFCLDHLLEILIFLFYLLFGPIFNFRKYILIFYFFFFCFSLFFKKSDIFFGIYSSFLQDPSFYLQVSEIFKNYNSISFTPEIIYSITWKNLEQNFRNVSFYNLIK